MKVLYFQISTTANSTSGYYPGYPTDTPFNINGQSVSIVAYNPYDAAIEADPLSDYNNYPSDWTSGIYVENGGTPYYWTRSYVAGSATFTRPSDYGQAYQNGDFKYEVAIVPDTFTLSPPAADLTFTADGLSTNSVQSGGNLSITYTLANIGSGAAAQSYIGLYWSTSQTFNKSSATLIGDYLATAVSANSSTPGTINLNLPVNMPIQQDYLFLYANDTNSINESNLNNNVTGALPITVTSSPPPTGSFTTVGLGSNNVTTFSGSVAPGATVKVYNSATLLNGTVTINNGTWTWQGTLPVGTYSQLNAVITAGGNQTTANSPISLVANASAVTTATFKQGSTGTLDINGTTMPTTAINGFAPGNPGDVIDLTNVPFDGSYGWEYAVPNVRLGKALLTLLGGASWLYITENSKTYALQVGAVSGAGGFQLSDDGTGGTKIQLSPLSRINQIKADLGSKSYTFQNVLTYVFKEVARSYPSLDPQSNPYKFSGEAIDRVVEERIDWDPTANADPILTYVDHYLTNVNTVENGLLGTGLGGQYIAEASTEVYEDLKLIRNGIAKGVGVLGSFIGSDSLLSFAQVIRNIGSTSQYPTTDPSTLGFSFAMQGVLDGENGTWLPIAEAAFTGRQSLSDPTFNVYDLRTNVGDQTVTLDNINFYHIISGPTLPALSGNETIVDNLVSNNPLTVDHGNNLVIEYVGNKTVVLGDGNNTIFLIRGNNVLDAGSGTNLISAGPGNDTFVAGSGGTSTTSNNFDGGAGWNKAVFSISSTAATITRNADGTTSVSYSGGIDTFNNVEVVKFNDKSIALRTRTPADFFGSGTSDILFRNNSGDTWFEATSNGAFAGWSQIGGSNSSYAASGIGDFYGNGTEDVLFRNNSTGDTWFEALSNGAFASWNHVGGSDTGYSVVGVGDFYGSGTDDVLFRNNLRGDTWLEAMSNGAFAGWQQVGGSDTRYSAVGVGDFDGNGTSDILFRNNSTGDTWFEALSNGAFNGWHQIGGSDTHYSVVGVGDFFGNGTSDILFRNNSTGDTWFEAMSNGSFGWHQVGGSDTHYAVVGIGDYFGSGTDDILFRNNSSGDVWYEAMSNGNVNGWDQVGGSDPSYTVSPNTLDTAAKPYNGHSYDFVSFNGTAQTWTQAQDQAAAMGGYLATITSQGEDDFIRNSILPPGLNGPAAFIGASDAAQEGVWNWVTGPENGTNFWNGAANGSAAPGQYANWATGEPNNSGGNENYAVIGGDGKWVDVPSLRSAAFTIGFVVEFN